MTTLNVLVSGAGIAGLTCAHYLLQAGHEVTVIERAPALRASGQNVDVRGHALTILRRMRSNSLGQSVEAAIIARATQEKGLRFVDAANTSQAEFPVDDGASFTGEIEIMRGDLANILYDSVKELEGFKVVFGKRIHGVRQSHDGEVSVELDGAWPQGGMTRSFDLLVIADGIASLTRSLAFPNTKSTAVKPLGQWSCWFSIPYRDSDSAWARWYNAPRGRMILIRPDSGNGKLTRVSLWTMTRDPSVEESLTRLSRADTGEQKTYWAKLFHDAGWEATRVIQGMDVAEDFYMQRIAQVKVDEWSNGRTVLLGDAGYCPSPISGMGVTTAVTGAYVLAGEVAGHATNLDLALKVYQEKMRPFVRIAQQLAPGTPGAANPETAWGIWFLHHFLGFIAWTKLYKLFGSSVNPPSQALNLPVYIFSRR